MEIKFIVMTCDGREDFIEYLSDNVKGLIVNHDDFPKDNPLVPPAWLNYQRGWQLAGESPTVQMDDDIIVTSDFRAKVLSEIHKRPNEVIQFFTMRKADLTIGSRYEHGSKFLMQQCYYLPAGMAKLVYEQSFVNAEKLGGNMVGVPTDTVVADVMRRLKMSYWVVVPNLVDHRVAKSAIDKRRSSKRQSLTFKP